MRSTAIANQLSLFCFVRDRVKRGECVVDAGSVPRSVSGLSSSMNKSGQRKA